MGLARRIRLELESEGRLKHVPRVASKSQSAISGEISLRFDGGLGDHVLLTGAMYRLADAVPGLKINLATRYPDLFRSAASSVAYEGSPGRFKDVPWARLVKFQGRPQTAAEGLVASLGLTPGEPLGYDVPDFPGEARRVIGWARRQRFARIGKDWYGFALIQSQGRTHKEQKDISVVSLAESIKFLRSMKVVPLSVGGSIPGVDPFPEENWRFLSEAARVAAINIGIDSGPSHLFAASARPAVICWTGHHPLKYFAPTAWTVHLVPADHEQHIGEAASYFNRVYSSCVYRNLGDSILDEVERQAASGWDNPAKRGRRTLVFDHGLGDVIQFTAVARELAKRFDLTVYCPEAFTEILDPWCTVKPVPAKTPEGAEVVAWEEPWAHYSGRGATKAEVHMRRVEHVHHSAWRSDYELRISESSSELRECALIHYRGQTSTHLKNVSHTDIVPTIEFLRSRGVKVVIVGQAEFIPDGLADVLWEPTRRSPMELAAIAQKARVCIGIDSGPGKVFQASGSPCIIAWRVQLEHGRRLHPVNFDEPRDNVMHLVPEGHEFYVRGLQHERMLANEKFAANYRYTEYPIGGLGNAIRDAVAAELGLPINRCNHPQMVRRLGVWVPGEKQHEAIDEWKGVSERDDWRLMDTALPDTVLDIGGRYGFFALRASQVWPIAAIKSHEWRGGYVGTWERNLEGVASCLKTRCLKRGEKRIDGDTINGIIGSTKWPRVSLLKLDFDDCVRCLIDLDRSMVDVILARYSRKREAEAVFRMFRGWFTAFLADYGDSGLLRISRT